jgi:hypothetical protein
MNAAAGMAIAEGKAYYGLVAILGKPYITGYEPMKDRSGNIIGITTSATRNNASEDARLLE